jgi:phosphoadenosine phosphosulfate reductase
MTTAVRPTPELAAAADARFEGIADPVEQALAVLRWAGETFGDDFAVTSSMADGLLSHLASRAVPGVNVVFLDTGYHFAETIGTRDWVSGVMPITLVNVQPEQTVAEQDAEYGPKLHDRDPDLCCSLRKLQPLARALAGYAAWGSGVRRDESPTRAGTRVVDWDAKRGMVKVNPLAAWTQ